MSTQAEKVAYEVSCGRDITPLLHVLGDVREEVLRAQELHPTPFHSAHEGYAIIREELDEFWDEVKKKKFNRSVDKMADELTQIAAMAVRARLDLYLHNQSSNVAR